MIQQHIDELIKSCTEKLQHVKTEAEIEQIKIEYLGRQGKITQLMDQLKNLPLEQKRIFGPALNALKEQLTTLIENKRTTLLDAQQKVKTEQERFFDVTISKPMAFQAHLHIFSQLITKLENIFISMGYIIADGPELEHDYYNFAALNIPADHPARESQDTFWFADKQHLMRTHTSPVQIRVLEQHKPPMAIFSTGRVYRNEATDASHDFSFMQAEAIVIGKNITLADLLGTAKTFLQAIFKQEDISIRVRPGYFPFVEPGIEIDCSCPFCAQKGCSVCKKTGWIELLGAGMVHPNVLSKQGIDPYEWSGFAFGMGIERLAMITYGINDIRLFRSNKLSFLEQF